VSRPVGDRKYEMSVLRNTARWQRGRERYPLQRTPQALFNQLDREFHFTLDAAASDRNAKCAVYLTETDDALHRPWAPAVVWCNPPYGRGIRAWVEKGYREAGLGALVVMLVPATTDLAWWHEVASYADEIRFIRGRVAFERENGEVRYGTRFANSFFSSAVLVFRPT